MEQSDTSDSYSWGQTLIKLTAAVLYAHVCVCDGHEIVCGVDSLLYSIVVAFQSSNRECMAFHCRRLGAVGSLLPQCMPLKMAGQHY